MIKSLRRKFIFIAMCSVTAVLVLIMGVINLINYNRIQENADELLQILSLNKGFFPKPEEAPHMGKPKPMSPETPYETRYFTAQINTGGKITSIDTKNIAAISTDEAAEYIEKAYNSGKSTGNDGIYKYKITTNPRGTFIVFLDYSRDFAAFQSFLAISLLVSLIGDLAVFVLVLVFSKKAVKPVAESYEKQKRFITDASHELKTPLTIINASAEVLEINDGENQWTKSIKKQTERLAQLTTDLVTLSRMDENSGNMENEEFSLSDVMEDTIEPFLPLAKSSLKVFDISIQKDLRYTGSEVLIRQLFSILTENALKYSKDNTVISIALAKKGKNFEMVFTNKADLPRKGNLDVIFERFYRLDSSRNTALGGNGIGLSIAKAIVLSHKGKISAYSPCGEELIITIQL